MYLSALELNGFKSFPNKTKLEFSPGVMAIVGPNGCGKSNLVDAVRWVLGEQRSSILRSDKMESVIFSGAGGKKAANYAEVTLVIENTENLLPSEYTQVAITRKLHRNGDSEYLINRRPARLKDIRELFADTGLGPDSYSIIELAMVNSILSSKPEERRRLFEEAAGVTLYKTRLRASMNRLDATQTNLVRLEDVIREVESQRNTLKRQVARAKRYRYLRQALRTREIKAASNEITELRSRIVPLDERIQKDRSSLLELDKKIETSEMSLAKKRGKLASLEEQLTAISKDHRELEESTRERERAIATLEERISNIKRQADQRDREREELTGRLGDYSLQINELHEKRERARLELRNFKDQQQVFEDSWREQQEEVSSKREIAKDAEEERQQAISIHARLENEISRIQSMQERLKSRLSTINDERNETPVVDLDEKRAKSKILEEEIAELENEEKSLSEQVTRQRDKRNVAQEQLTRVLSKTRALEERVGLLESIVEKGQGRPKAVEALLTSGISDIRGRLGDFIQVDDDFRVAVSSVLGEYASSILLNSRLGLEETVNFLRENKRGSALLSLISTEKKSKTQDIHFEPQGKLPICMSEIVSYSDRIPPFIKSQFQSTFVVESQDQLFSLAEEAYGKNCALVTLEGDFMDFSGVYHIGAGSESDLGAHSMLEMAGKQLSEMGVELETATAQIERIEAELKNLVVTRDSKSAGIRENRETAQKFRIELSKLEADFQAQEALRERKQKEVAEINEELKKYENQLTVLQENITEAKKQLEIAEEQF
ncbi:AAA family ATPase, partial [bacterium]|nr:AAA family ATPase [bacterium]